MRSGRVETGGIERTAHPLGCLCKRKYSPKLALWNGALSASPTPKRSPLFGHSQCAHAHSHPRSGEWLVPSVLRLLCSLIFSKAGAVSICRP